jgi:hypothetical protein
VRSLDSVVCCLSFVRALTTGWELKRNKQETGVGAGPLDDSRSRSAAVVAVVQRPRSRPLAVRGQGSSGGGAMGGPTTAAPPRPWTSPFPVGFHSSRNLEQSTTCPEISGSKVGRSAMPVRFLSKSELESLFIPCCTFYPSRLDTCKQFQFPSQPRSGWPRVSHVVLIHYGILDQTILRLGRSNKQGSIHQLRDPGTPPTPQVTDVALDSSLIDSNRYLTGVLGTNSRPSTRARTPCPPTAPYRCTQTGLW